MRTLWTLLILLSALVALLAWALAPESRPLEGASASAASSGAAADKPTSVELGGEAQAPLERDALAPSSDFAAAQKLLELEQRPKARITGRLVDESGAPLVGVRVLHALAERGPEAPLDSAAWEQPERKRGETQSDDEGRFVISPAPEGWVRLAFRPLDHEPRDLNGLHVATSEELALGDLEFALGKRLAGHVLDANGAPVEGAWLIRPSDLLRPALGGAPGERGVVLARTDSQGAFDLRGQPNGPWTLLVHSPEHPDFAATGGGEQPSGDELRLVLRFPPAASLRGRVVVSVGPHAPALAALEVVAYPVDEERPARGEPTPSRRRARPLASGEFEILGVAPQAPYRVRAVTAAPGKGGDEIVFDGGVDARGGDQDLELRIAPITAISFVARDARSGEPVDELEVQLLGIDSNDVGRVLASHTRHEGGGRARVLTDRAPAPGESASLSIGAKGYFTLASARFAFDGGASVDLGQLDLEPRPKLEIRVVDAATGAGVKGARAWMAFEVPLAAPSSLSSAPTDSEGRTTLYGDKLDCGRVTARGEGYASADSTAACFSSGAQPLELALSPGASLLVRVHDAQGAPAPSRRVQLQRDRAVVLTYSESLRYSELSLTTDGDGLARFEGATPGAYRVALIEPRSGAPRTEDEHARTFASVVLTAGAEPQVELFSLPRGTLSGRVTCSRRPLARATVTLTAPNSNFRRASTGRSGPVQALTDGAGRYRIDDLGAGAWNVSIAHPEFIAPTQVALDYDGDERTFDLELPRTALVGRIVDSGGNPIAGARLVIGRWQPSSRSRDRRASPFQPLPNGGPLAPTSDDGGFLVLGAPAERLAIEVRHSEFQTLQTKPFVPTAGVEHPLGDLVLEPAGRVAIALGRMDPDAPRPRVILRRLDGPKNEAGEREVRTASLDVRGKALVRTLAPGKWRIELDLRIAGQARPRQDTQVRAGQTSEVVFESP